MTETAPPLPPAASQQPVEPPLPPAPKRRVSTRWVAIGVVAAGLAATVWIFREPVTWAITSHSYAAADTPTATRMCDSDTVTVHSMTHDGVSLGVTAPGPNVVQVDVWNGIEHRRNFQQVTLKDSGASFAMWDFSYKFSQIDIDLRIGGPCTVPHGVLAELNRANGWTQ
jgi:hypothetical protein